MRKIKLSFITAVSISLCLLSACSSYEGGNLPIDDFGGKSNNSTLSGNDDLSAIDGNDAGLANFGNEAEILPDRPNKEWTPVAGLNFPTVYFAFDQSRLGTNQMQKLDKVANYLTDNKNLGLIIEGHCDERGSHEYNIGLGERRALAVRDYLEKLGIPANRLQTISYGSEKPAVSEHNNAAWVKNRRAELIPAKM